ncbi:carbohydrate-binding family 9-like protein [Labilibacter marinus]|uniref:carbohydrate-binding family 9-like protein n=1 Tax=Labilibacter marinus TaxID=1477105 RepID=UPI00082C76F3|nr:carbohydrate-binding family 9-like protein [Labilibacter marinus]
MSKLFYISVLICLISACTSQQSKKIIQVPKANSPITIDGIANEQSWQNAKSLTFNYYYRSDQENDKQGTSFKMLWDEQHIYLLFECEDKYITARMKERDGWTFVDDCAEIFLSPMRDQVGMHFGFETNLYKATNDFIFINEIYPGKKFVVKAYNPDFKVEVNIDGTLNDNSDIDKGWCMEMAIPIAAFHTAGPVEEVKEGSQWTFLALRQDRNKVEGQRVSTSTLFPMITDYKDVHNPKTFGVLEFTND